MLAIIDEDGQPQPYSRARFIADAGGRAAISLPAELTEEAQNNLGLFVVDASGRPDDTVTMRAEGVMVAETYTVELPATPTEDEPEPAPVQIERKRVRMEWALEPKPLAEVKAALRARVTEVTRAKQDGTAPTPFGVVDSDINSRNKLNGAVLMAMLAAQAGQPFALNWTLADNSNVALDGPGMIAMASAVGSYVAACHANGQALKAAIDEAEDHAALEAIDVEEGWPG